MGKVASALGIKPELIKKFVPEDAIYNIQNNYDGSHTSNKDYLNYQCTFNSLEKYLEAMEEIKKLYAQLLQSDKEKVELLQKLLAEGK